MNRDNWRKVFLLTWVSVICHAAVAFAGQGCSVKPFFEIRQKYDDNVFEVPKKGKPQHDFVTNVWAGVDVRIQFDREARLSARYEAAPRKFADFSRKNRQDHLLALLFRRRLGRRTFLLTLGNLGLRSQPNDPVDNYFKQDVAGQLHIRWTPLWSSQFGAQFQHKSFPNNYKSTYRSVMVEGRFRRRLGGVSAIRGGYQWRAYDGAVDPRVLQANLSKDMDGIRQTASIKFEGMVFGRVLMDCKYQIEFDTADRDLQLHERFPKDPEQTGQPEGEDGEEDADFNFLTHRVASVFVWRLFPPCTVSLYARHDFKCYRDWPVPATNRQRHDDLTFLRLYFKQKLSSGLSARLGYALVKNNSNDPTQTYTSNIYSIGLQFAL